MLKENKNSSVSRTREIKAAVRAYKTASAEILKNGGAGALSRAASLCPVLCTGARSSSKNIAAHASLPFFKGAEEEAFSLAEAFLESGEKANDNVFTSLFDKTSYELLNVKVTGVNTAEYKAKDVYLSAFIIDGEDVYYLGQGVTSEAVAISYDKIFALNTPSSDEE